jgi:Flp pilus assembly protein CpaB
LILAVAGVVLVLVLGNDLDVAGLLGSGNPPIGADGTGNGQEAPDLAQPAATPTPSVRYVPVVVTQLDIPLGTRIEEEHLTVEMRPETNIAVQAGYTFSDIEEVANRIARADVAEGQAVLNSMIALSPRDLASIGSDIALYVNEGHVAIAMPVNRYSGAAYAMRPGDMVDVIMSLQFVKIDDEFQTALPNFERRISQLSLDEGRVIEFLFEPVAQGRLELIPTVNLIPSIGPGGQTTWEYGEILQIPRRVTQLTIQQAEVLWVGAWQAPIEAELAATPAAAPAEGEEPAADAPADGPQAPTPTPEFGVREERPDVVILGMTPQDALAVKWAMDRGVDLNLALRAQGDATVFATTSVSLPLLIDQGGLTIPERTDSDIHPRADEVEPPSLPPRPVE